MLRKAFVLLIAVGLMAGFSSATAALFTGSASVTANTFTTGTVNIASSPSSGLITFTAMAPGDKVTAPLTVSNSGTLELRYAMTTAISGETGGLAGQLELEIRTGVTTCSNAGFTDGSPIYNGTLTGAAIGNPTQGSQAGDRTLAAATSEVLCFQARLPLATGNTFQGTQATAEFDFAAEQTANNP